MPCELTHSWNHHAVEGQLEVLLKFNTRARTQGITSNSVQMQVRRSLTHPPHRDASGIFTKPSLAAQILINYKSGKSVIFHM
jgi:hypothetical protein